MLHFRFGIYRNPIFWIIVALTSIALFLGLGLAYFSSTLSSLFEKRVAYRDYLQVAEDLKLNLVNAETGQRGYLITRNSQYLKPYNDALPAIKEDLKKLDASSLSNPYRPQVKQITQLTNQKSAELQSSIDALNNESQEAAFAIVNTDEGIEDMDTLRRLVTDITDDQNNQLQSGFGTVQDLTNILKYLAPIVAVADVILIVIIFLLTQRAIRREQQLESLKEQFIALASHQLRTPATAVKQYLALLIGGSFGTVKKEQKEVLQKISDSNDRGIRIANNLLNVTRADSNRAEIGDEPIDLSRLLRHVLTHYTEALQESRDQLIVTKIPKKPIIAKVDQFQVRLIYENLIENASKYSDDHKNIYVTLKENSEWITFSVQDKGQGISKKDIPMLFKKFSRLDPGARKAEGSGLGLYLVKQAVEMHDGDVTIKSEVGKGSEFIVRIKKVT